MIFLELKNLEITVDEILKNKRAREILKREFPALINSPLLAVYSKKSIRYVIDKSKNIVSPDKIERIISELKSI